MDTAEAPKQKPRKETHRCILMRRRILPDHLLLHLILGGAHPARVARGRVQISGAAAARGVDLTDAREAEEGAVSNSTVIGCGYALG
jgi:hypothetical protein